MKKLSILFVVFSLAACGNGNDENSLEAKQESLEEKQAEMDELRQEIDELKEAIAEMDTTAPRQARVVPVKVRPVQPQTFDHYIDLTGTVTSKENIMISSEANGRVVAIPVSEGQKVKKGQVLLRLDNEAVSRQLEEAQSVYKLAKTTYEKRKNLWDQNIGSEIEYLQAENNFKTAQSRLAQTQTQYNNTIIKAPISGAVDELMVNAGEFISYGAPIVRVVDLDQVEIEAELSEEYLAAVQKGDTVKVNIPALGLRTEAAVTFVSQVINPDNRSFKVKVSLPNPEGRIKPNVLANLKIRDYSSDKALVVPSSAISKDLKGDFVYTAVEENGLMVARKKYIKRGRSSGVTTEIKEGLSPSDRIIVSGYDQVSEGSTIDVKSDQA